MPSFWITWILGPVDSCIVSKILERPLARQWWHFRDPKTGKNDNKSFGWWFGTFFIFPDIWNNIPVDSYFSEGFKPPTSHRQSPSGIHQQLVTEVTLCWQILKFYEDLTKHWGFNEKHGWLMDDACGYFVWWWMNFIVFVWRSHPQEARISPTKSLGWWDA